MKKSYTKKARKRLVVIIFQLMMILTVLSVAVAAASARTLRITASDESGAVGSEVEVKVLLSDNPGFSSLSLEVAFDSNLTLKNVTYNTAMGGKFTQPQSFVSPVTLSWFQIMKNYTGNGEFATLTFEITGKGQTDGSAIRLSYNQGNTFDAMDNDVVCELHNGSVTVLTCVPGDINGDGDVNNRDISRFVQYFSGYSVAVNQQCLDTTGDGKINNRDLIRLIQYLSGWKVTLHCETEETGCRHDMVLTAGVASTCNKAGNIPYWYCKNCLKYFRDESGKEEIALTDTVLPLAEHTIVIDPAVAPTATATGLTEGSHCSVCGRILVAQTVIPALESGPAFVVSSTTAKAGENNVEVTISLKNNPGLSSIGMSVSFDSGLTLTEIRYNTAIGGQSLLPQTMVSPIKLTWVSPFFDVDGDQTFVTLIFSVSAAASVGEHSVTVTYDENDVYDMSEINIPFAVINGAVTVTK